MSTVLRFVVWQLVLIDLGMGWDRELIFFLLTALRL